MEIIETLNKIAGELDDLGYFEQADELDLIIEAVVEADTIERTAAGEVQVTVKEDAAQNQWTASTPDGRVAVSSPIYQTAELRAAGNKGPGIQAMRTLIVKEIATAYPRGTKIVVNPPQFGAAKAAPVKPAAQPGVDFTMGPATITNVPR